jgi:hypothetical protein
MGVVKFRPEAMADVADENSIISARSQQAGARVFFKDLGIADVAEQSFYRTRWRD